MAKDYYETLGVYKGADQELHYQIIKEAMRAKLEQNPKVKEVLASTKGLILKPDHRQDPPTSKAARYHEIWMELR
jgi:predicted NAD-dependent protein-ADP-ribosyltransferase YbiA (DUF1768 family)